MKVTVRVELDDGTVFSDLSEVYSDADPRLWSQAVFHAATDSLAAVVGLVEAKYGATGRLQ